MDDGQSNLYPFVRFSREDWARLPADASFSLSEDDVLRLGAHLSPEEATQAYLPLSRLLYLHVRSDTSPKTQNDPSCVSAPYWGAVFRRHASSEQP
jgi:pantothenate kinase